MSIAVDRPGTAPSPELAGRSAEAPAPKNRMVVAWAVLGAACIALMIYVFAAWIASPYFRHETPGVTPIPDYVQVAAVTQQVSGVLLTLVIGWWVVWRPYRRDGRLTTGRKAACTGSNHDQQQVAGRLRHHVVRVTRPLRRTPAHRYR